MNTTTATTTAVPSVPMSKMEVASQIMEEEKEADKETSKRSTIMEEEEEEEDCDDNCSCAYESDYIYEDISDNEDEDEQRVHHRYRHHQEQEDLRSLEEVGMKRKHPPSEGRGKKATAAGLKTTGLDDFSTAASTPKRSSLSYYSSSPRPSPSLLLVELSPAFCQTCQGEIHTPVRHCEQVQEWLDRQITVASSGVFFFAPNLMIPAMKRRLKQVLDELPDDEEHQRFYENDRATGYAELQQIMRQYRWDVQAWLRPIINRDLQQMQQQQQQQLPFDPFYNFRFLAPLNRHRQNLPEEQRRLQLMRRQRVARPAARNNINNDNNNNSNNVRQPTMFARLLSLSWMRRRQDNNSEDSFNEHSDTEVEQWNDSEENDDDHVRNQNTENSSTTSSSSNSSNDDRTSGSSSSSNNSSISNNNTITSGPSNTTGETIHGNEQQQAEISNSINNNNVDVGINRGDIDGNNNENTANHTNNTNTTNVNGEDQEETVHNNHDEAGRVIGGPIPAPDAWERDGNATVATAATTAAAEPEVNQMTCKDFICNICMDDEVPPNERYSIGCNHAFCLDCWKAYLENQLQDATPAADFPPSCPHQSCQRRMNEEQVRFLTPHAIPKYRRLLLYPFVEGHAETMRWCPGPECDRIAVQSRDNLFIPNNDPVDTTRMRLAQQQTIRALQGLRAAAANNSNNNNSTDNDNNALIGIANRTAHFVCCDACKTEFCFSCGEKPHPGQTCREYATVLQGDSGNTTANAAAATTTPAPSTREKTPRKIQKCPSCTVGIEKNGGCNHMTCKCGHEFCWL